MSDAILLLGNCLDKLKELPDNSVDSVVTDPPYGLSFMGKKWDYDVPSKEIWKEVLRVLKPGGHLLSFGGTRTYHRLVVAIEDAGFEIRDQIQWIYGSGFPKSHNLKDDFEGWGTALKPANEPICVARKPLSETTVAKNVLKWGCGAINIDESRINVAADDPNHRKATGENGDAVSMFGVGNSKRPATLTEGRWPANVIFDEVTGCAEWSRFFYVAKASKRERNAGLEGMPLVMGGAISGKETRPDRPPNHTLRQNHHPTVKPIKLMEYLIKLVTPPGGIVLDPFTGSGTTGVAAVKLGFDFIGCEMSREYLEIAEKRINHANIDLVAPAAANESA